MLSRPSMIGELALLPAALRRTLSEGSAIPQEIRYADDGPPQDSFSWSRRVGIIDGQIRALMKDLAIAMSHCCQSLSQCCSPLIKFETSDLQEDLLSFLTLPSRITVETPSTISHSQFQQKGTSIIQETG